MKITSLLVAFSLFCTKGASAASASTATYFGNTNNADTEYTAWLATASPQYARNSFLPALSDPTDGMAVHWTIQGETIQLAVVAKTTGWLGFGTYAMWIPWDSLCTNTTELVSQPTYVAYHQASRKPVE
jgi:hypothetical protein